MEMLATPQKRDNLEINASASPYLSSENTPKNSMQLDRMIGDYSLSQEISQKNRLLSWKATIAISGSVLVLFLVSWILYWAFHAKMWNWSFFITKSAAKARGFWRLYLAFFHRRFWIEWKYALPGILLLMAPSKMSAFKSIWIFFISNWTRTHFQIFTAESRPYFIFDLYIWRTHKCDCSYGMPSQMAEEGVLLYLVLLYEFTLHRSLTSKTWRVVIAMVMGFILLHILLALVVFGTNNLPQVANGILHAAFYYCLMLLFTTPLTTIFRHFLEHKPYAYRFITGSSLLIVSLTFLLWYWVYRFNVVADRIEHVRCGYCFYNSNAQLARKLTKLLAFPAMLVGSVLALLLLRPIYVGKNESMLKHHFSKIGLLRILILAASHFPLLLMLPTYNMKADFQLPVRSSIFILTGFTAVFLPVKLNAVFQLNFVGDLFPATFDPFKNEKLQELSPLLTADLPLHRRNMDARSHQVNVNPTIYQSTL